MVPVRTEVLCLLSCCFSLLEWPHGWPLVPGVRQPPRPWRAKRGGAPSPVGQGGSCLGEAAGSAALAAAQGGCPRVAGIAVGALGALRAAGEPPSRGKRGFVAVRATEGSDSNQPGVGACGGRGSSVLCGQRGDAR